MQDTSKNKNLLATDGASDIKRYFRLIRRKKWTILIITSVVFVLWMALAIKFGPRPIYETNALIQFEDRRELSALDDRSRPEYEGKIGVLLSRNFLGKVIDRMSLTVRLKSINRIHAVDSIAVAPNFEEGKYLLQRKGDNIKLFFTKPDGSVEDKIVLNMPYPADNIIEYGGYKLFFKPSFWSDRAELDFSVISREKAIEALRLSLVPSFKNRLRTLLNISIQGEDRDLITNILNTVLDEFLTQNLDFKKFHTREVLNILTEQLRTAQIELDEAEKLLKDFREKNPWIGLNSDASVMVTGISIYETEKAMMENRRAELDMLVKRHHSASGEAKLPILNEILSFLGAQGSSTVPALVSEFSTLTAERTRLLASYSDTHPYVIENQRKLDESERKILLTANNQKAQYENQLSVVASKITDNSYKMRNLPAKELQLAELQRKRTVADQIYSALLVRHNQAKIADAVEVGDIIILDKAVVPFAGSKMNIFIRYAFIGLALGLVISLATVFIQNLMDKTVRTSDELEKIIPIRVIAKIPTIHTDKEIQIEDFNGPTRIDPKLVTADYSPTPVGEAYRSLRTQLLFTDKKAKSIIITSLNPNEGKSLNAGNLAITFAQQKLPTLLVDGDLRRGVLHSSFACKKKPGLSDFLYSIADITDENIRKIIQQTHIPNLYLLSSGMPVPNPSEILGSQRGRDVFDFLRKRFGFVIVDTPPISVTTDCIIISQYVDSGLFVVRAGKSNVELIKEKMAEYPEFAHKLAGIVLNFTRSELRKGDYKYSYYNY